MEKNQTYIIIGVVVAIILLVVIVLATRKEKKTTSTLSSGDMSKYATAVKSGDRMKSPSKLLKTVPLSGYNNMVLSDQNGNLNSMQFPRGMIMMWFGTTTDIPEGWSVCDGTKGTPDLRGRFLVGANPAANKNTSFSTYEAKATADSTNTSGQEKVTLTEAQIPPHTHTYNMHVWGGGDQEAEGGGNSGSNRSTQNTGTKGGGQSHENRPPFYAMVFIMKL